MPGFPSGTPYGKNEKAFKHEILETKAKEPESHAITDRWKFSRTLGDTETPANLRFGVGQKMGTKTKEGSSGERIFQRALSIRENGAETQIQVGGLAKKLLHPSIKHLLRHP